MESKTARLTLLIDPNKKVAFERLCAQRDLTASQVVRQLIRDYLVQHGVSYTPSGQGDVDEPAAEAPAQAQAKAAAAGRRGAARAAKVAKPAKARRRT